MPSKAFQPKHAVELPRYPTIPTIDFDELERAQVRGRELQAHAVRETFAGLFRSAIALLRGARPMSREGGECPPLATSNPG